MASISKRTHRWVTKDGVERTKAAWQASYVDRAGGQHRKSFPLKREAQRWLDEQTTGLVTGLWVDPSAGRVTLQAFGEAWLARQVLADGTLSTYRTLLVKHIYPTLGAIRLEAITREDVQKLVKHWSLTAAASTVEARYTVLSIVLKAAVTERRLAVTPCTKIALPRRQAAGALVPITTETVLALADAIAPRYRAFVLIGAGTGMRRSELLGLTLDRVSPAFGTVRVDRQLAAVAQGAPAFGHTKTPASVRTIPVAQVVLDVIEAHVEAYGTHESGLLLTTGEGNVLRKSTLFSAWSRAAKKVGTDATPHDLRHYFASVQIRGGQSIKVLQALLGHKSAVETLDTYGHLMGDEDGRSRALIAAELAAVAVASAGSVRALGHA